MEYLTWKLMVISTISCYVNDTKWPIKLFHCQTYIFLLFLHILQIVFVANAVTEEIAKAPQRSFETICYSLLTRLLYR